jgi:hemerythrin superfamily protein
MGLLDALSEKKHASEKEDASAIDLLEEDHDNVRKLFEEFRDLEDEETAEKRRLFTAMDEELTVHSTVEEEIFYPAVKNQSDEDAQRLVLEAIEEHAIVKNLLDEIRELDATNEEFDAKMKVLMESVEHHAEEEEDDIFPKAKKLGADALKDLGARIQSRKRSLAGAPARDAEPMKQAASAPPPVKRGRTKRAPRT